MGQVARPYCPTLGGVVNKILFLHLLWRQEFIAFYETTTHALWLRNFLSGFKIVDLLERSLKIFYISTAIFLFSKNNKSSSKSKKIDIKYLSVRESIKRNEEFVEHISTQLMNVDPMTKGLPIQQFKGHVDNMGLDNLFYIQFLFILSIEIQYLFLFYFKKYNCFAHIIFYQWE